jgi:integrase
MKTQQRHFASALAEGITQFLTHKRALGRRFEVEEKTLCLLDRFLVQSAISEIDQVTPGVIDAFLATRPRQKPRSYNHLLGTVRRLFDWLVLQGLVSASPVHTKPRRQTGQRMPFIFDRKAAFRLWECAASLQDNPRAQMRGMTYRTIFALLYGLGLRVGEVSRLCYADIDFERQLLVIRQTKFSKSRLIPFGPRIGAVLRDYVEARRRRNGLFSPSSPVFSFGRDRPINSNTISQTFHALVPRLGLEIPSGVSPPRLHDLRHSFAVGTLLRWYRSGIDPQSRLLYLSTFLGHVSPESTAVYLTISTELLQEANRRFEQFACPAIKENSL